MITNYNFNFFKNLQNEIDLRLSIGKETKASLHLEQISHIEEVNNNYKLISCNTQTYKIRQVAFDKFVNDLCEQTPIKIYSADLMASVKEKFNRFKELEHITRFTQTLINLSQCFRQLRIPNAPLSTKFNAAFRIISTCEGLLKNFESQEPIFLQLEKIQSQTKKWLNQNLESFSESISTKLNAKLFKLKTLYINDLKDWTPSDIQDILRFKALQNECLLLNSELDLLSKETFTNTQAIEHLKTLEDNISYLLLKMKNHPFFLCAREAARLGHARCCAISDSIQLIRQNKTIQKTENLGAQTSFMLGKAFLKVLTPKAAQEERSFNQAMSLSQPQSVVGSYYFKDLNLSRLGVSFDEWAPHFRRYPLHHMTIQDKVAFSKKLKSPESNALWASFFQSNQTEVQYEKSYQFFSQHSFKVKLLNQVLSFSCEELLNYLVLEEAFGEVEIAMDSDSTFYPDEEFLNEFKAIDTIGISHKFLHAFEFYQQIDRNHQSFFSIEIPDANTEALINRCEAYIWEYKDEMGEWKKVTFQKLYALWANGKIKEKTLIKDSHNARVISIREFQFSDQLKLITALETPTTFTIPELIQSNRSNQSIQNVFSKPKLEYLWTFDEIMNFGGLEAIKVIFQRLDSFTSYKAFLTLLYQVRDLHSRNVGATPKIDENFIFMNQFTFSLLGTNHEISLFALLKLFISKKIDENSLITLKHPKQILQVKIKDNLQLHKALSVSWELQLFDGDSVGGEDENISIYSFCDEDEEKLFSMVPIRDFFLQIRDFRIDNVEQNSLSLIRHILRDKKLENWLTNKHTFIWHFIDKKQHKWLEHLTQIEIRKKEYTLGFYAKEIPLDLTLLNRKIAIDLSDLSIHATYWKQVQQMLKCEEQSESNTTSPKKHRLESQDEIQKDKKFKTTNQNASKREWKKTANWFKPHIVSDGDFVTDANGNIQMQPTLAKLANVYHVDYKELIQLNGGKIENLSVGMSIRVKQDLLTDTPGAKKQREHIAYAILSKESWRQKQSRQNKIERCLQYLDFYDQMLALQQSNTISFDLIHQILDSSITPFTSEKKQALLIQFQLSKLMNPVQFLDLIIKEYTPTLEKLAFVMYPFLADLITLIPYSEKLLNQSSLDKKDFWSYEQIGHASHPIEYIIEKVKINSLTDSKLAHAVQEFRLRFNEEIERQKKGDGGMSYTQFYANPFQESDNESN